MKVLVVNNMVPFIHGGAEELALNLVKNLRYAGVEAELLRLPFSWHPPDRLLDEIMIAKTLPIHNTDRVIALKFPAYLMQHSKKTIWLIHQYRQAYDLWDTEFCNIPHTRDGAIIRKAISSADNAAFAEAKQLFVSSPVTQDRLRRFNAFDAEILLPPLNDPDLFNAIDYQPFIFAGGRINQSKRQHLLVEAMRYVKADVKLVIVGPPDTESDAQQLRGLVERYHLENRVTVRACFVSRKLIGRLVSRARACAYLPVDEDSLGYVTMEACEAAKPVLTTTDAGGVLELVRHRETGWVADPSPEAIAAGIDMLGSVRHTAERLGRSAHALLHSLNLTWPYTIERLLS